ncbi:hypothetical protein LA080_011117 [Diaporthe eres]|nr:hypothetical protein LA080_011117 [Diaporthe eres]
MVLISYLRLALCTTVTLFSYVTCRAIADQPNIVCNTYVSTWLQLSGGSQTAWPGPAGPSGLPGPPGPPGYQTTVSRPATPSPSPIPTKATLAVTAGQPFFFSLVGFLDSPSGLVTAINTNPNVDWIHLDRVGKSISGQVPIDYPAGPVTVTVTAQYNIAGRDVDKRDFETQLVIVLNVFFSASTTTPGSAVTPTPLTTVSRQSPSSLPPPITTSAQMTPTAVPWVTSTFTPPSSTTLTAATDLSSTTTTAPPTTRTRPTAVPTPTIYQGKSFTIGKEAYELNEGDILNGVSSSPPADWIRLSFSQTFRPCCITGVVPADWAPGPVNVTLDMYSRFTSPSFQYFTSFIVIVMESAPVSTTSAT